VPTDQPHGPSPDPLPPDRLTGAATVEYLAALGGCFSLVRPQSKAGINIRTEDHGPETCYLDAPVDADAALRHLARGGNVGLLPEHSAGLAVIDVDYEAEAFIQAHPALAMTARIVRANAPERVKLVVMCPDVGVSVTVKCASGRKVELIGARKHAIIAGRHESGAEMEMLAACEIPILTWADLVALSRTWVGPEATPPTRPQCPSRRPAISQVGDSIRRRAINWWNEQPANIAAIEQLLAACPRKDRYFGVRPSDRTPSTIRTDVNDGYYKATWRDHGSNETLDRFELYCRLTGANKNAEIERVLAEYRDMAR
jgi:hypothetical protein